MLLKRAKASTILTAFYNFVRVTCHLNILLYLLVHYSKLLVMKQKIHSNGLVNAYLVIALRS